MDNDSPHILRANPYFRNHGPWFDWALFHWEGYKEPIPAQIKIILDLRNVTIETQEGNGDDDINVMANWVSINPILTNDVFFVVYAGDGTNPELPDNHFGSCLCQRIKLEQHWTLAPASDMCSDAYVIPDIDINNPDVPPHTAVWVKPA